MIRIGFTHDQKQQMISEYLAAHNIRKIYCFYYKDFPYRYDVDTEIEYIEYADIEMYKYFYRLLEEIDENSLIIIDELMRTRNRAELIYNCSHHYLNQTPHRIVFEYFPIIEEEEDFMILLNFENKGKYHGKGFDYSYLKEEDIVMRPHDIQLNVIPVEVSEKERERYEKQKEKLFEALGNKHPDTIPRNLQLLAGDFKKKAIEKEKLYVARNKRHKLENVVTYRDVEEGKHYIVVDFHYRRLNFNDFLKRTGTTKVDYLSTGLSIDNHYVNEFVQWKARLENIYAQASIHQ
ncbi:hypothetical protein QT236_14415 [Geobacillus stearothermophilus]|nr:hypothetical protein QT236_14415 [Geobacillus stearothermophilus]